MRLLRMTVAAVLLGLVTLAGASGTASATRENGRAVHGPGSAPAHPFTAPEPAARISARPVKDTSWTMTKPVVREFVQADGSLVQLGDPATGQPFQVTVTADHTQNLRGRERVEISWSGAQPSAGRSNDPFGLGGMLQEYPVVVLQCRGTGDTVAPETCWTSSFSQRSQVSTGASDAAWTEDLHAPPQAKEALSSSNGQLPSAEQCPTVDRSGTFYTRLVPFVAASGTVFPACDAKTMPPEAAAEAALPPAEIAAFTDAQGNGSVQFEVRTEVENESLGCSKSVACSIVVVPISGISCDQASTPVEDELTVAEKGCRRTGQFAPGSSNFTSMGVDQAVSPALWWSESNWRNRFVIPVTFGDPPDTCDVLDPRPPTGFYGSELLAQAALQWAPAYCLSKKRFKFQHNQMPDVAGWNLMTSGGAAAAVVSSRQEADSDPVGYAPTAVTGFGIGYVIDRPDNAGEYTELRLNARLLAKLVTQSYTGSSFGAGHPGMATNPWAIMADPEFVRLNPGLDLTSQEAGATLLSLSNSSDVIRQLTEYIAADKEAMDFVNGKADPWGMVVNPTYKRIKLPRDEWPLLDEYIPTGGTDCRANNPSVYFNDLAAPVSTMHKIAEALLDSWPNVQTRCDTDLSVTPPLYKVGRIERQHYGQRFMLGVVSLGDAARYGLRTAALETTRGRFVAADVDSMSAAVRLAKQEKRFGPFEMDMTEVRKAGGAYPGTMIVYTAARLQNLPRADAEKVALFIRTATTEGQRPGSGNGELPDGFVPIVARGVTEKLVRSAREVAAAVERQKEPGPSPAAPTEPPVEVPVQAASGPESVPVDAVPQSGATAPPSTSGVVTAVEMPATRAVGSEVGGHLLPLLLLAGLVSGLLTTLARVVVLPRNRR